MPNPFKKPQPQRFDVDGVAVLIRPMSAGEFVHVTHLERTLPEPARATFAMLKMCVLDTQGQPVFTTAEDAEGIDPTTAAILLQHCRTVNALDADDAAKKNN